MNWYKITMKGGRAEDKDPSKYNQEELNRGIKIELEHTNNKEIAKQITMDHLEEFPNYYEELEKMEKKLEDKK